LKSLSTWIAVGIIAASIPLLCYPMPVTIAPEWTVRVVDERNLPLPGATVIEYSRHYSVETTSHEENLLTDSNGSAHFTRRVLRVSLLARFMGCVQNFGTLGAHVSCGPHSHVVPVKCGYDNFSIQNIHVSSWPRFLDAPSSKESNMELHACPPGKAGVGCLSPPEDDLSCRAKP
jgi:hypothetical protein